MSALLGSRQVQTLAQKIQQGDARVFVEMAELVRDGENGLLFRFGEEVVEAAKSVCYK